VRFNARSVKRKIASCQRRLKNEDFNRRDSIPTFYVR
jgi:hypothetical protein